MSARWNPCQHEWRGTTAAGEISQAKSIRTAKRDVIIDIMDGTRGASPYSPRDREREIDPLRVVMATTSGPEETVRGRRHDPTSRLIPNWSSQISRVKGRTCHLTQFADDIARHYDNKEEHPCEIEKIPIEKSRWKRARCKGIFFRDEMCTIFFIIISCLLA